MVDPEVIRGRMLELEDVGKDRTVGEAAAEILGVPHDESFDRLLSSEVWRTTVLCRTHYTKSVAALPNQMTMTAAMLQGITLAAAIGVEGVNEARYWRERAIALGAGENDYRDFLGQDDPDGR